jgi:hypothetical protein
MQESELPLPNLRVFARPGLPHPGAGELPTICSDVAAAAHAQTRHLARNAPSPSPDALVRVEAMIGVISYCYVKGIFESNEIERRLWRDETFLASFGNELPTAQKIRVFRRQHRAAILATIEHALAGFRQRSTHSKSEPPAPGNDDIPGTLHAKAEHLLEMASVMDRLASDSA